MSTEHRVESVIRITKCSIYYSKYFLQLLLLPLAKFAIPEVRGVKRRYDFSAFDVFCKIYMKIHCQMWWKLTANYRENLVIEHLAFIHFITAIGQMRVVKSFLDIIIYVS